MATARVMIKNGKVVDYMDRYFGSISEDAKKYFGNGWEVTIVDGVDGRPGKIVCHSEREYSDGLYACHKEFALQDGTVGLAGGNITERYAYFRSEEFQDFLAEFNIDSVRRLSAMRLEDELFCFGNVGGEEWYLVFHINNWGNQVRILYTDAKDIFSLRENIRESFDRRFR